MSRAWYLGITRGPLHHPQERRPHDSVLFLFSVPYLLSPPLLRRFLRFSSLLASLPGTARLRSRLPVSRVSSLILDSIPRIPRYRLANACFSFGMLRSRIRTSNHRETRHTVVRRLSKDSKNTRRSKRFVRCPRYLESEAAIKNHGRQKRSAKSGAWLRAGPVVYRSRDRRMKIHWKGSFETRIDRSTAVREIDCRHSVDG